ncbi:MAG: hypothetical protein QXZ70_07920 [Candidatus Bathyarchaeia archaeon]
MIENAICYNGSTWIARIILVITFSVLLTTLIKGEVSNNHSVRVKTVSITLILSSAFFLIWRSSLFMPHFIERNLDSETISLSQQYTSSNHLIFDSAHSYFFLQPLVLHFLCNVGGFSSVVGIYVSLLIYGVLVALIGILVYKTLTRYLRADRQRNPVLNMISPLIAFLAISFAYSERSGYATNFSLLLTLMLLCFLVGRGFKDRRESVILFLLVVGVTIGDTNGILLLIPFFFLYSFFARKITNIVYALIPFAYLILCAQSYTLSLKKYATFAISGFVEFLQEIMLGQLPERVIPWQRTTTRMYEDVVASSMAYLSLLATSLMVIILFMFIWTKKRWQVVKNKEDAFDRACLICLSFWLSIVAVTYIGASFRPETSFSDIRTIVIVLLSLLLPFLLMSKKLISYIKPRKVLLSGLITLIIMASMRTAYEVYPKSIHDPIYAVEDSRLGLTGIYVVDDFLNAYYKFGGIIGDYKLFNRIGRYLPDLQYEKRWLSETALNKPFARFPYKSILVFNVAGTMYPSVYHSHEAYMIAYNFSISHNRLYDNGIVIISFEENVKP